jgi:hypothetical protein
MTCRTACIPPRRVVPGDAGRPLPEPRLTGASHSSIPEVKRSTRPPRGKGLRLAVWSWMRKAAG